MECGLHRCCLSQGKRVRCETTRLRLGNPHVGRFCSVHCRGFRCPNGRWCCRHGVWVTATSVLLSFGLPPATASASVHAAEVFTTGISGAAHWRLGNIQWATVRKLAIPGMFGGALGAYVLTAIPAEIIKPLV